MIMPFNGATMSAPTPVVSPLPATNQVDALAQQRRSRTDAAQRMVRMHVAGLRARQQRDLLSEKLLIHIDGTGDFQWADIFRGQRVEIPRILSEFRKTENLLRLVVDNAVAHHTTMALRYFSEALSDRRSRERAVIDTILANHIADQQDLNGLFADALYMSMATGFCPMHRYWRDDRHDQYESVEYGAADSDEGQIGRALNPTPGMLDCWVGNPFDTVFDAAAKRGSIHRASYTRVLPAELVRSAFGHVAGAEKLEGSTRIPSAANFQRIAQSWNSAGLGIHGSGVIDRRRHEEGEEELIVLLCQEVLPGVDADWPEGLLRLAALPGAVDLRTGQTGEGNAVLLVEQPLPAGDFSFTNFYSGYRGEDVHGKPWIEDIDPIQVDLNLARSKRWEYLNRGIEAPIIIPCGALDSDMMDVGGYNVMEIEPSMGNVRPRPMEWPAYILQGLDKEIEDLRRSIYTGGGYQAVSRGESPGSRMAYRAIVALQQADNTIHGPVNMRFRRAACDFMRGCWKQFKRYGDVAWLVPIASDEYGYLADGYIDNTKVSDGPPNYKLVNAFGPSPELRAQEVLELMQTRGADGQPFLLTEEARRLYPNPMVFDVAGNPKAVQRRRARTISQAFHDLTRQFREQSGLQETDPNSPAVQQAAQQLFQYIDTKYRRLRDDDLEAHLGALSEVTQDESADIIARTAAGMRQEMYFQWQAMMAQTPGLPGPAQKPGAPLQLMRGGQGQQPQGQPNEDGGAPSIAATAR
jgi:hypothetical protein